MLTSDLLRATLWKIGQMPTFQRSDTSDRKRLLAALDGSHQHDIPRQVPRHRGFVQSGAFWLSKGIAKREGNVDGIKSYTKCEGEEVGGGFKRVM